MLGRRNGAVVVAFGAYDSFVVSWDEMDEGNITQELASALGRLRNSNFGQGTKSTNIARELFVNEYDPSILLHTVSPGSRDDLLYRSQRMRLQHVAVYFIKPRWPSCSI